MALALVSALMAIHGGLRMPRAPAVQHHAQLRGARTAPISMKGVPITGSTLQAALKWQCDVTGSGYAIYWANVNGKLAVAGDYTSEKRKEALRKQGYDTSFAVESETYAIDESNEDPVAECFRVHARTHVHVHARTHACARARAHAQTHRRTDA